MLPLNHSAVADKKAKVAVLVQLAPRKLGSMEDWLLEFVTRLARDHQVAVATYAPCHPQVELRIAQCGASWHDLSLVERTVTSARKWLAQHAHVAHFSLFAPRSRAVVAAWSIPSVRVVFQDCYSSPSAAYRQSALSRLLDRVTFARTDKVVAVSEYVAQRNQQRFGVRPPQLEVVYNGVDTERFAVPAPPSMSSRTVCVAALIPDKGVDVLVRAFADSRLKKATLTIAGDGPQRPALELLAAQLGIADRIEFLGIRDDVQQIVGNAAVVVHPAIWGEAFGLTIAEAMSAGRPVIGCSVGAVPELVTNGMAGIIIPPGDATAMATALSQLLDDAALRDRLGGNARARVEHNFTMRNWVDQHVRIVAGLSRAARPTGRL